MEPLRKGIVVDGEAFQPMTVMIDRHQGANAWLTVGLREGKNREIRRAMASVGLTVNRLIRVCYGPFRLNDLNPGEVEEVKPRVLRNSWAWAIWSSRKARTRSARTPARGPKVTTAPKATTAGAHQSPDPGRGGGAPPWHLTWTPSQLGRPRVCAPKPRRLSTRNVSLSGKDLSRGNK